MRKLKDRRKYQMENWNASSAKCPLCGKKFIGSDCKHNIAEANDRLFENYIKEIWR